MAKQIKVKRERKVFVPILVVDSTKEKFDEKKGNMTADAYLNQLMK